jgi:porin
LQNRVYDVNVEFSVLPGAGDSVNGPFGFGPEYSLSGVAGPGTVPTTGLARRGRRIEDVSTKVAAGGWAYTKRMEPWAPDGSPERSWGRYLLGEQLLHRNEDGGGRLSGFARVGAATRAVNRLDPSVHAGLLYRRVAPDRPDHVVGLGIARARNGAPFLQAQRDAGVPAERGETVAELTYRGELGGILVFQLDIQWVRNPGMDRAVRDAPVLGLRAHLLLAFP